MRVAVATSGASAGIGGGYTFEREVLDQLLRLAEESPHTFVVLDAPHVDAAVPANVTLVRRPIPPLRLLARVAGRRGLDWRLARLGIDVVWNLFPFHRVSTLPYLSIVWDLQHRLQPFFPEVSAGGQWRARERQFAERLQRAALVIAGTEAGKHEIARFYGVPEERIRLLPHPTPRFALEAASGGVDVARRFGLDPGFILYPAQFWPHKNHVGLLLALAHLRAGGLRLPLVLVGSDQGSRAHVLREAQRLGLEDQVRVLGFVSTEELVALYRTALCLAYVSFFGPENLPPLEAFALGCPVVAAEVPGAREQLGEAAVRVDATRPDLLAGAIRRLHEEPALRAGLIERGRARARAWTGAHFVRGAFTLLDELVPYTRCWRPLHSGERADRAASGSA
jgi:glycosyltransferase involved in cell wall biosynthesis